MFINSNELTEELWNVQARFMSNPVTWIILKVANVYLKYCFLCSASGCWETENLLQKIWTKASTQTAHCSRPSWRILWSSWVWPIPRLCWVQADLFRMHEFSQWNTNVEFASRVCVCVCSIWRHVGESFEQHPVDERPRDWSRHASNIQNLPDPQSHIDPLVTNPSSPPQTCVTVAACAHVGWCWGIKCVNECVTVCVCVRQKYYFGLVKIKLGSKYVLKWMVLNK